MFAVVIGAELAKLRRSKVTWTTLAASVFMVGIAGFFMWMMKNPGVAQTLGLMGRKASFAFGGQAADWPGFLTFIVEMEGIGGLILCSIIVTYVFGREYVEGTAKNMLALPVGRAWFVLAKVVVSTAWFAVLTLVMAIGALFAGTIVGLGNLTARTFLAAVAKLFELSAMSLCCSTLVAWVAVETRGYFAPLGFSICTLVMASVFGHTGWGPWVPWSIVGLYSGAAGAPSGLGWGNLAVLAVTLLLGAGLTIRHETWADNTQ